MLLEFGGLNFEEEINFSRKILPFQGSTQCNLELGCRHHDSIQVFLQEFEGDGFEMLQCGLIYTLAPCVKTGPYSVILYLKTFRSHAIALRSRRV